MQIEEFTLLDLDDNASVSDLIKYYESKANGIHPGALPSTPRPEPI